jgi:hypothetical protein
MGRRGNGEGSITRHKKSGKWMARYTVETPAGPKRRTIYADTRNEAGEKLAKALANRADGIVVDDKNLTMGEYLDRWLSDAVRGTIRESTYSRDKYLVTNHIKPSIGRLKLKSLNALHLHGPKDPPRLAQGSRPSRKLEPHPPQPRLFGQGPDAHAEGDAPTLSGRGPAVAGRGVRRPARSALRARCSHRHEARGTARPQVG